MTQDQKPPTAGRRLSEIKVTPLVVLGFISILALFSLMAMGVGLFAQHLHHLR